MRDRRENARDKVIYGGVAEIGENGASRECIVRNISDKGASVEFSNVVNLPREQMSLRIARKGRSFLAKVVWWRDNFVGLAFSGETPCRAGFRSGGTAAQERNQEAAASAPHQGTARRTLTRALLFRLNRNRALNFLFDAFSDANRCPLRLKTLYSAASFAAGGGDHATMRLRP